MTKSELPIVDLSRVKPVRYLYLWVLAVCAALVAGCGGGTSITNTGGGGGTNGGGGGDESTTVTVTFAGTSMPTVVAAKIGTSAFAAQTLSGSTLSLSIPSGTSNYAVAYLCPALVNGQSSSQVENVYEASIQDGTSLYFTCPYQLNQTPNLTGSLDASAIPGVQSFAIESQNGNSVISTGQGGGPTANFNVPAPVGNDRVLVLADANQSQGPVAAKNFDNQTVPGALNGGNTVVFGAGDQTTSEAITYNNVPSGFSTPQTYVTLDMGGRTGATEEVLLTSDATMQYAELPASATETGDAYYLDASTAATSSSSGVYGAVNAGIIAPGGPVSLTFPAPWSYAGPTPAALPSFTMGYTGYSGDANVTQSVWLLWPVGLGSALVPNYSFQIEATASYQGGSTTLAFPDLSGVTGFLASPASGTQVQWTASILQQSWGLTSQVPLNATLSAVSNTAVYTVP